MKRILLITSEYPTRVATFITRDIEVLTNDGYKVDLYALYPKNDAQWEYVPQEGKKLIEQGKLTVNHIRKIEIVLSVLYFWNYFSWDFFKEAKEIMKQSRVYGIVQWQKSFYTIVWTIGLMRKESEKNKYCKVISYWGNYSGTSAYLFSKYSKYKLDFFTYLHAGVDLYRDQIYLLEKLLFAKRIITVCQFNKDFLQGLYPKEFEQFKEKVIVYHLPLKIRQLPKITKLKNKIIAVGRLDRKKGLDYLIEACAILKAKKVDFNLTLVGDGPERKGLENFVEKKGVVNQVDFLGHMPYSEVEKEISSSIVLAHCSPELGDAVPTVIKESLSLGTPVIGSNIVGIPELLDFGKCGLLFEPKDTEGLVNALIKVLSDTELQDEMSIKGRQFAEKMFDFDKNKTVLLNILNNDTNIEKTDK